jgi:hypothetical protein
MLLLAALPSSWRSCITTQASVANLTVKSLMVRIRQKEIMRNGAHNTGGVALTPSTQYAAQRQPHFRRGTPFRKNNNARLNTTPKLCLYYRQNGHLERECRTKRLEQQLQSRQQQHGRHPRAHFQQLIETPKLGQYSMESLQLFTSSINNNDCVPFNKYIAD